MTNLLFLECRFLPETSLVPWSSWWYESTLP